MTQKDLSRVVQNTNYIDPAEAADMLGAMVAGIVANTQDPGERYALIRRGCEFIWDLINTSTGGALLKLDERTREQMIEDQITYMRDWVNGLTPAYDIFKKADNAKNN